MAQLPFQGKMIWLFMEQTRMPGLKLKKDGPEVLGTERLFLPMTGHLTDFKQR